MINISNSITIERISPSNEQFFFGYYDISPENQAGTKVLVNKAPFIDHMPEIGDELEVGYIDICSKEFTIIGKSGSWNFQEGCRLQWLDNEKCIYNTRKGKSFVSVVYDVEKKCVLKEYNVPIYSVSNGYALTYSFTNNKYSYAHTKEELQNDPYKDGVFLLNLDTGDIKRIISNETLDRLAEISDSNGHVEYCVFNQAGNLFYLYYRWSEKNGQTHTMVCVSDINGNVKKLISSVFVSHAGWCGNDRISAWGRLPGKVNALQSSSFLKNTGIWKFAVKVFHTIVRSQKGRQKFTNDAYIMFDLKDNTFYKISNNDFTGDGHCTWSKNERYMLTDTYPDTDEMRHLLIYDYKEDLVKELGLFFSYARGLREVNKRWNTSPMRCDLHPKWGSNEEYVYFDSVHEGFRGLYRIRIKDILGY